MLAGLGQGAGTYVILAGPQDAQEPILDMGSPSCELADSFLYLSGDETGKPACVQMATMVSQGGGEGTCLLWKPWLSFSGNWESSARSGSTEPLGALLFSLPVFSQCSL